MHRRTFGKCYKNIELERGKIDYLLASKTLIPFSPYCIQLLAPATSHLILDKKHVPSDQYDYTSVFSKNIFGLCYLQG